ncbi:1-acylglycerol-3-phosphate O-acyltransferase [Capsaspora owczarzaki ATCC 30864]|uniref:1-acylglycerol-3-phosphate O-acyltransferase n=2 Tax=Capsaspora owczarzaki (strain ATCC 30864) TaxID=595528 RepID=A0A0D2WNI6_CAPO3|nr:1-acylglycerol-3-phosphate O-acyltransferase [Capsaspora owczarzaki ATCC 30864]
MAALLRHIGGTVVGAAPLAVAFACAPSFTMLWSVMRVATAPLPIRVFERCDVVLYDLYQSFVSFFYEHWAGVRLVFHGDVLPSSAQAATIVPLTADGTKPLLEVQAHGAAAVGNAGAASAAATATAATGAPEAENVLYMSNHQCAADWVMVDLIALRHGALGRIRYMMKRSLRLLPLYGWYFAMHSCVFVRKNWNHDQRGLLVVLDRFRSRNMPIWLVVFPEGTRFEPTQKPAILERSKLYCAERGWPQFEQVLPPRINGFRGCVNGLRNHIDAVYDVTVMYSTSNDLASGRTVRDRTPSMLDLLARRYKRIDIHIRRHPVEALPMSDEGIEQWLVDRFQEKNNRIKSFLENGTFAIPEDEHATFVLPQLVREERVNPWRTFFKSVLLVATLVPFVALEKGRKILFYFCTVGTLAGMAVSSRY